MDPSQTTEDDGQNPTPQDVRHPMIPESHHGTWAGQNRLWVMDPANPFRSDGSIAVQHHELGYTWTYEDKPQTGVIRLSGQPAALRADWMDTFHAADGIVLNGYTREGIVHLYGTYPAGDGVSWGWQIELDSRDPESFTIRMFNVMPGMPPVPAVALSASRR